MSTTLPQPPSAKTEGECVVCGKICSTRCSSCAQSGLDWMYFCSTEHQRLIWFAHKRTCGVNSTPFRWPSLDEREKEDCRKFKDVEYENSRGRNVTLAKLLAEIGVKVERMMEIVAGNYNPPQMQALMAFLHSFIFCRRLDQFREELSSLPLPQLRNLELSARLAQAPYGYLAFYLKNVWEDLKQLEDRHYGWYSDLHHRLLILFAIIGRNNQNPKDYLDNTEFFQYAKNRVVRLIDEQVSLDQPEQVQKLKAVVNRSGFLILQDPQTGADVGLMHAGEKHSQEDR